jgi:hypothetical protein
MTIAATTSAVTTSNAARRRGVLTTPRASRLRADAIVCSRPKEEAIDDEGAQLSRPAA